MGYSVIFLSRTKYMWAGPTLSHRGPNGLTIYFYSKEGGGVKKIIGVPDIDYSV